MTIEEKKGIELATLLFEAIDDLRDIGCEDIADNLAKRVNAILEIPHDKNP